MGAIGDQESDEEEIEREREDSFFSKTLTDALGEEEDISETVAIYRHKDSQRYAARGSIGSASSHCLTRGQLI